MRLIVSSLLTATTMLVGCDKQPAHETSAIVVNIAPGLSPRWQADKVLVTARSLNGLIGGKIIPLRHLNCHVGDVVQASAQGITLTLDERACQH